MIFIGNKTNLDAHKRVKLLESIPNLKWIGNTHTRKEERNKILDEQERMYQRSRYALSVSHYNGKRGYTSNRLFNICGSGGLAVVQYFDGLLDLYNEAEVIMFEELDGLKQQLEIYDNQPEWRLRMRFNAWNRTRNEHTWAKRYETLLGDICC